MREEEPVARRTRSHVGDTVTRMSEDTKRARIQGEKRPAGATAPRSECDDAAAHHPTKVPKQEIKKEDEPMELSSIKHSY